MISYCVACYRPRYSQLLIEELIRKTSTPFEILLWLNVEDSNLNQYLKTARDAGAPIRILGSTPHNIGMEAYFHLFAASRFEMVAQIDDDVICISPRIAQVAATIFSQFADVGMLTANVWQDEFTSGARPPMDRYTLVNREFGLYDGPIDGWFAVYRKYCLRQCQFIQRGPYVFIGGHLQLLLPKIGMRGLLCTRMKVFHVRGPQYSSYFDMLDFEIQKYSRVENSEAVRFYRAARKSLPPRQVLATRIRQIQEELSQIPGEEIRPNVL